MSESTLFIPDISGFTKFVKSTELSHSKHIIEELISIIVTQGKKSFEVAEVEGDAVFLYKETKMTPEELVDNAKRIYVAFHKHLRSYEHNRLCECGACTSAIDLKLKFIVHSGDISLANYGTGTSKPFGDAVIVAHRLLKNQVPMQEYILFTDHFVKKSELELDGDGTLLDESLGEITFKYLKIDHWKAEALIDKKELQREKVDLEISINEDIDLDAISLHRFISQFKYRHLWNKEAERVEYNEDAINQMGAQHFCVVNGKDLVFDTIKPDFTEGLSYGEILKNPAPLKYMELNFLIREAASRRSHLKMVIKASLKWKVQKLLLPVLKRKLKGQASKTVQSLKEAIQEVPIAELAA